MTLSALKALIGTAITLNPDNSGTANYYTDMAVTNLTAGANVYAAGAVGATDVVATHGVAAQSLAVKEGTNAKMGVATLVGGTVTVANTSVTANSRIFLSVETLGGTIGTAYISAKTAGTSFVITSSSATDTSTLAYLIVEPA